MCLCSFSEGLSRLLLKEFRFELPGRIQSICSLHLGTFSPSRGGLMIVRRHSFCLQLHGAHTSVLSSMVAYGFGFLHSVCAGKFSVVFADARKSLPCPSSKPVSRNPHLLPGYHHAKRPRRTRGLRALPGCLATAASPGMCRTRTCHGLYDIAILNLLFKSPVLYTPTVN